MQGRRRARRAGDGRRTVLPGVLAQRDRVRSVTAHALRHRIERPVRARVDRAPDRDDERWHAVASTGARRGHMRGYPLRARGPGRAGEQRDIQCRTDG